MKALFITYNQALTERIDEILSRRAVRGFTKWELTQGRGTVTGEPHLGSHTWPAMNSSTMTVVEDEKVAPLLEALRELDAEMPAQGCRAFVWSIEDGM